MKTTGRILIPILAVCFLALAGCKKAEPEVSGVQFHGINVDLPKLDAAFANATPDVQASLTSIPRFFRYAQFPEALMELDKLANNPSLTESQKKLVADLIEQTKQVIAKTPAPSGQ